MFKSPLDSQGGGGGKSLCPGPGAAQRKLLSQELFNKQMGGGKEGRGTEKTSTVHLCERVEVWVYGGPRQVCGKCE